MRFKDEFNSMNIWEWSAAALVCLVMAYYSAANFPLIAMGCLASAVYSGVMAFVRYKNKVRRENINIARVRRFIFFRFKR